MGTFVHLAVILLIRSSGGTGIAPGLPPEVPFHAPPTLWAGLTPGSYRVGYRRLGTGDRVVHLWYPTAATGEGLAFRDILDGAGDDLAASLTGAKVDSATVEGFLESRLYALGSPPPLDEPFPLVLVAQGNGEDAGDQAVLCEYLASRGLAVASTPSPMLRTPLTREDQVGELAEEQARDLAAAIAPAAAFTHADTSRLGAVGHSFGARAALLLAMNDTRVRALVSLDGGIGTATAVEAFRTAPSFRPAAALPPLLHFYEELDAFMTPDFTLLDSLHTASLVLRPTRGMHHVHFTTMGFAAGAFPALAVLTHAGPETVPEVTAVARQTGNFLLRYLGRSGSPRRR
jgi:dienelactone hydrolase